MSQDLAKENRELRKALLVLQEQFILVQRDLGYLQMEKIRSQRELLETVETPGES